METLNLAVFFSCVLFVKFISRQFFFSFFLKRKKLASEGAFRSFKVHIRRFQNMAYLSVLEIYGYSLFDLLNNENPEIFFLDTFKKISQEKNLYPQNFYLLFNFFCLL